MNRRPSFLPSPIVLAPIAGPATVELAAAAANAGAFAILACPYSDPVAMRRDTQRLRELTDAPFGINLFIDPPASPVAPQLLADADRVLDAYRDELGIPHRPEPPQPPYHYDAQIDTLIELRPRVFSFTFGIPSPQIVARLKAAGIATLGTATTVEEACELEAAGIDAICAQGAEAGGHRGSFTNGAVPALIGTLALVPQVVDAVKVPVIAAGGITDGRGIAAALALGACAAQIGTAFLLADEASTAPAYRDALGAASSADTALTQAFSGRWARGIQNRAMRELADPRLRAPYPYQNALTRDVRTAAAQQGRAEFLSLWAGQAFPLARAESAAAIVTRLITEAREAARSVLGALDV